MPVKLPSSWYCDVISEYHEQINFVITPNLGPFLHGSVKFSIAIL